MAEVFATILASKSFVILPAPASKPEINSKGAVVVGLMAITAGAMLPGKKRYHGKYCK